jgi:Tol biopolymer transport system component
VACAAALAACGSGSSGSGKIVFSAIPPRGGESHLYVVDPDGSNVRQLTRTNGDGQPSWSPDGSAVAFRRWSNVGCERPHEDCARIWIVGSDGTHAHPLTPRSQRSEEPDWSPDGTRIAYVRWRDDRNPFANATGIYVVRADGTGARPLTEGPGDATNPVWSPDGRSIAFLSDRDGNYDIYVMRADASRLRQLTHTPDPEFAPAWSADGKHIAFQDAQNELVVMDADGGGRHRVTGPLAGGGQPAWSPDGKLIAFLRIAPVRQELYVVGDDGSGLRSLAVGRVSDPSDPDWGTMAVPAD